MDKCEPCLASTFHDFCETECPLNAKGKCSIADKQCPAIEYIKWLRTKNKLEGGN